MVHKVLGAVIIIIAGFIAYVIFRTDLNLSSKKETSTVCVQLTPAQQLINLIKDDFQTLSATSQLPMEWNSLKSAEFKLNSELARIILGKARPTFPRIKEGKYHLELDLLDLPDEENPGLIIQASLIEIKSKNKIFEIGRTYRMNDLNKIPHEAKTSKSNKQNK